MHSQPAPSDRLSDCQTVRLSDCQTVRLRSISFHLFSPRFTSTSRPLSILLAPSHPRLSVGRGDKVALISNNRVEWAVAFYAVAGLGGSVVPMYEAQMEKDWRYIVQDSGAKLILAANEAIYQQVVLTHLPACDEGWDCTVLIAWSGLIALLCCRLMCAVCTAVA
jgi:long-subunit acyl-CoA synthetase (AMP-forming)